MLHPVLGTLGGSYSFLLPTMLILGVKQSWHGNIVPAAPFSRIRRSDSIPPGRLRCWLDRILLAECLEWSCRHPRKLVVLSTVFWIFHAILVQLFHLQTLFLLHVCWSRRFIQSRIICWMQQYCWWCWVPKRLVVPFLGTWWVSIQRFELFPLNSHL